MELRNDKIDVVSLASIGEAFRNSLRDGSAYIHVTPQSCGVFSIKDMLKDMTIKWFTLVTMKAH